VAVLLLELWLDYRKDTVLLSQSSRGLKRFYYRVLTLGSDNISPGALHVDDRVGWVITLIGIPSAFLLHGHVGFIFGSVKANPWWSTPLMPVVFLFSAMVSGIALIMLVYMVTSALRKANLGMRCLDTIAKYLFYTFIIDFTLEMLDLIHRIYEADESFRSLNFMVHTRLFVSQILLQVFLGTLTPLVLLAATQLVHFSESLRKRIYSIAGVCTLIGILAMRWNVVIGGQLFSKSFLGYTTYKMGFVTREGLAPPSSFPFFPSPSSTPSSSSCRPGMKSSTPPLPPPTDSPLENLRVLRLCLLQNRNVLIRVFPQGQKILIRRPRLRRLPGCRQRPPQSHMR